MVQVGSRSGSVGIANKLGAKHLEVSRFVSQQMSENVGPRLEPKNPLFEWIFWGNSRGIKRPWREAAHSLIVATKWIKTGGTAPPPPHKHRQMHPHIHSTVAVCYRVRNSVGLESGGLQCCLYGLNLQKSRAPPSHSATIVYFRFIFPHSNGRSGGTTDMQCPL